MQPAPFADGGNPLRRCPLVGAAGAQSQKALREILLLQSLGHASPRGFLSRLALARDFGDFFIFSITWSNPTSSYCLEVMWTQKRGSGVVLLGDDAPNGEASLPLSTSKRCLPESQLRRLLTYGVNLISNAKSFTQPGER